MQRVREILLEAESLSSFENINEKATKIEMAIALLAIAKLNMLAPTTEKTKSKKAKKSEATCTCGADKDPAIAVHSMYCAKYTRLMERGA